MQLQQSIAPHFRRRDSVKNIAFMLLILCGVLLIPAIITHGFRAVIMALSGILGAVSIEAAWCFFSNKEQTVTNLTAVVTGLMCALLIPAECPVWAPFFAAAFAIGVVKLPFGGPGRSVFNPAALGGCFALLCWGTFKENYSGNRDSALFGTLADKCYGYVQGTLPVFANVDTTSCAIAESVSPLVLLAAGDRNIVSPTDAVAAVCDPALTAGEFFLAGFNGPMGTTASVLIIICGVAAALFGVCAWQSAAGFLGSIALISLLIPYNSIPLWQSPLYDLFTGATLFAAVFLVGDIMTAPHMNSGRFMYGVCAGVLTMILRRIGAAEGCEMFAAALMNPMASVIDQMVWKARCKGISFYAERKKLERKLRRLLHISPGPFDSFDFDDEEDDDGTEI